jgi:hypothetical protein
MSRFTDLRSQYIKWTDQHWEYRTNAAEFVRSLTKGFAAYIEAPDTYKEIGSGSVKRYVEPIKAVRDESGEYQFSVPENALDVVTRDEEGFWTSGITLVLDRGADAFPKAGFQFFLRFLLKGRQCELNIDWKTSRKFSTNLDNPAELEPIYECMVQTIREILSTPPWSTLDKPRIGFALPTSDTR